MIRGQTNSRALKKKIEVTEFHTGIVGEILQNEIQRRS